MFYYPLSTLMLMDIKEILIISTENEHSIVMDAILAGANNYLIKPFTPDSLKTKLAEMFPEEGFENAS